jgi:hypothetical protein
MSATGMPKKVQLGSSRKKDASLLLDCFRGVTKHKEHWNKWMVDQCWIDVMKERCGLNESMHITAKELNGATGRNAGSCRSAGIDKVTSASSFGIYKSSCRPSEVQSKARIRVTAHCIATPGTKPSEMPGGNSKWCTSLVSHMPDGMNTRQNPRKRSSSERPAPATTPVPAPAQKKRRGMATRGDAAGNAIDLT